MYTVYKVISPSNKVYIGITKNSMERRRYSHELRTSNGSSIAFHNAIRKYSNAMVWSVIRSNLTKDEAILCEIDLIAKYKSLKKSYNICDGGEGTSGYVYTECAKAKIREGMAKVDCSKSDESRLKISKSKGGKSFKVIDLDGNTIGIWQNLRKCERDLDIPKPHIWRCLKGLRKSTRNLRFEYL